MKGSAMKKLTAIIMAVAVGIAFVGEACAKGRTGSHRVGGTNSHGKGSHYVGGYVKR